MGCCFDGCENKRFAHGYCAGHAAQIRRGYELTPLGRKRPDSPEGQSWCSTCKQHLPLDCFPPDVSRDGKQRVCRSCRAKAMKAWYKKNRERVRRQVRLRSWGLAEAQFDALFEAQNHQCAICGIDHTEDRTLCVDHDHVTGRLRGLLCRDCNLGIGQLDDSVERLRSAIRYLEAGGVIREDFFIPDRSQERLRAAVRSEARAERRS